METLTIKIVLYVLNAKHQLQANHFLSKMMRNSVPLASAHYLLKNVKHVRSSFYLENIICWTTTRGIKNVSNAWNAEKFLQIRHSFKKEKMCCYYVKIVLKVTDRNLRLIQMWCHINWLIGDETLLRGNNNLKRLRKGLQALALAELCFEENPFQYYFSNLYWN